MTHKIDIDVTFKSPETATLAFGLLYHAANIVAQGCKVQLEQGMADAGKAAEFLEQCMRQPGMRDAVAALAGRLMQDTLASLSSSLEVDAQPVVERIPEAIVRDGLIGLGLNAPDLEAMKAWSHDALDEVAGWTLQQTQALLKDPNAMVPLPELTATMLVPLNPHLASFVERPELAVEVDGHVLLRRPQSAAVSDQSAPIKPRVEYASDGLWHMVSSNIIDGDYLPGVRVETRGDEWRVTFEGVTMAVGTDPAQVIKEGREAIRRQVSK